MTTNSRFVLLSVLSVLSTLALPQTAAATLDSVAADVAECGAHVAALESAFAQAPTDPSSKAWVRLKLRHMVEVDQYARLFSLNTPAERHYAPPELTRFNALVSEIIKTIDEANTVDLKALLATYRWFTIRSFGNVADNDAWLLVQHADRDPDFQRRVLAVLEGLWPAGETSPQHYAYLFDRVAASWADPDRRQLQRYGTQGTCAGPSSWQPLPIEDPAQLDLRRAQVGLGSEADYLTQVSAYCH